MIRRLLVISLGLALATPAVAGPAAERHARAGGTDAASTGALAAPAAPARAMGRTCDDLPLRIQLLRGGKGGCPAPAGAASSPAGAPAPSGGRGPLGCGVPGDTAPRCPTAVDVEDGPPYTVHALPSPDGRQVHVLGAHGGASNTVVTYDAATGKRIRTHTVRLGLGTYPYATALSPDGRLLLVGGARSRTAAVAYLLDLTTGRRLWLHEEKRLGFYDAVHAVSLDVPRGRALLGIAHKEKAGRWTDDWVAAGLDLRSGRPVWRHQVGKREGLDQYPTGAGALRDGRWLLAGTQQGGAAGRTDYDAVVRTYDTTTGRLIREHVLDAAGEGATPVDEGWWDIDVAPGGRRAALAGTRADYRFAGQAMVAVVGSRGRPTWSKQVTGEGDTQAYAVGWAGDRVVMGGYSAVLPPLDYTVPVYATSSGLVVALDGASGRELWRRPTGGPANTWTDAVTSSPDGRRIYASGMSSAAQALVYEAVPPVSVVARSPSDGYVAALDATTGSSAWTSRFNHAPTGTDHTYLYRVVATAKGVLATGYAERASTRYVGGTAVYPAAAYPLVLRYDP